MRLSCDHTPELAEERGHVLHRGGDVRRVGGAWRVVAYVDELLGRRFDAAAAASAAAAAPPAAPAAAPPPAASTPAAAAAASARASSAAATPAAPLLAAAPIASAIPPISAAVVACAAASSRRGGGACGSGAPGAAPSGRPMLLSVTRALGDLAFKAPRRLVSCVPHVHARTLEERDRFLILASDGLWDALSDVEAVQLASDALRLARPGAPPAQRAADALLARAQKLGTTDNTTVLVVVL